MSGEARDLFAARGVRDGDVGRYAAELLEEDRVIGGLLLGIKADDVKVVPVDDVFAR
jgi:hypothetical protein